MPYNELTYAEERVIIYKGTERAFTGEYNSNKLNGKYKCKRCGEPLYNSNDKFESNLGWPCFVDEIEGAVRQLPDSDGRTEILCVKCGGHLGYIFKGERFTVKDIRHCVNSISIQFIRINKQLRFKV